jgi:(p)ppGpp synthase/HD superfamily hydrolase
MRIFRDRDLEHALEIAMDGHYGQKDHAGEPYILHLHRVMEGVREQGFTDNDYLSAAALHDLLEDTDWTLDRLRGAGIKNEVVAAVWALTHRSDESYGDYVKRVAKDEIARIVKIADLRDHLARKDAESFHKFETYKNALSFLSEKCPLAIL